MPESVDRIERLEREMRRLRGWVLVLGIALVATFALGATQGTPDELTLRRLAIVDGDGKERIVARTLPDGEAEIRFYDKKGTGRVSVSTSADGGAGIRVLDYRGVPGWMVTSQPRGASVLHVTPERYKK
jgi:hypothetical protein